MDHGGRDSGGYLISKKYAHYLFILLFVLYLFDYIDRFVVSALFPFLKADLGFSDTQCGLLISAVYWSVTLTTFPIAILVDRWSRTKSIGIMAIFWSIATAVCAFGRNFPFLFSARVAVGLGEAGYVPGGYALISAYFPEKKRARMNGIWNAAVPLGAVIGIVLGGFIAEHWGWRHAFGLVALPGLLAALLFFTVKDYKTVELVKTAAKDGGGAGKHGKVTMGILKDFLRTPSLLATFFGYTGNVFVTSALLGWLPSYYYRLESLPMDKASMKASVIMILAVIGAPLGGIITDYWGRKRENARMLFPAVGSFLTTVFIFLAFFFFTGTTQYIFLLLSGLCAPLYLAGASAVTQDVVHPGVRSISYSICLMVQNLLGSSLGPLFVGVMSDRFGLVAGLKFLPLFSIFGTAMFMIGSFFYVKDLRKVERINLEAAS